MLICLVCGRPADHFNVVNALGEQIWPVPADFVMPDTPAQPISAVGRGPTHILHHTGRR